MSTILVVDDEPNYLIVITELLQDEGFEVCTAQSGEEGISIIKKIAPDLVITDMQMPGIDGLELLSEVRGINKDLPVIIITAYGETEKLAAAMQEGAFCYMSKPFNNDDLIVNIRKAVELRKP
jgi:two-component system NtrC family response regulator